MNNNQARNTRIERKPDSKIKPRLVFYCSECGDQSDVFEGLSHDDCPAIKGCTMGHNIRTMGVK